MDKRVINYLENKIRLTENNYLSTRVVQRDAMMSQIFRQQVLNVLPLYDDVYGGKIPNFNDDLSNEITDKVCTSFLSFSNPRGSELGDDEIGHHPFLIHPSRYTKDPMLQILAQIGSTMSLQKHTALHNTFRKFVINGVNKDALSFLNTKNVSDKGIDDVANTLNNYLGPFKIAFDHTYSVYLKVLNEVRKSITAESVLTVNHLRLQRVREYIVRYYWNYLKEVVFRNEKSFYQIAVQYLSAINLVEKLYDINVDFTEGFYTSSTVTEPQPCVRIEFKHPTNGKTGKEGSTTTYIWDKRNVLFPLHSLDDVKFEEENTSKQKLDNHDEKITEDYRIFPQITRSKVFGLPKNAHILGPTIEPGKFGETLEKNGCKLISAAETKVVDGPDEFGWIAEYNGDCYYFESKWGYHCIFSFDDPLAKLDYSDKEYFDTYINTLNDFPNLEAFKTKVGPKAAYVGKNYTQVALLLKYLGVGEDDELLGKEYTYRSQDCAILIKYENILVNAANPFIDLHNRPAVNYMREAINACAKSTKKPFSKINPSVCLPVLLLLYDENFYNDLRSYLPDAQSKKECDEAREELLTRLGE